MSELASELADEYENLGRYDDAIAAMQEAVAAGWAGGAGPASATHR
ncbi:hypothetical protein ACQBAU_02005 [Propionibacteriaceae bacterium Y2011]